MAFAWLSCCTTRGDEQSVLPLTRINDDDVFFDCIEDLDTPYVQRPKVFGPSADDAFRSCSCADFDFDFRDCSDLAVARAVLESTREEWLRRVRELGIEMKKDCPEMTWATLGTARRFLNAMSGKQEMAVKMFVQALELRFRDRDLYQTMRCEASSDMRVIGQDVEGHPIIYFCARSQTVPIAMLRDQFILTLEAACKMTGDIGQVAMIADMHGLQPHLSMNPQILKELGEVFGTVFAERICRITVVDSAHAATALWWLVKPLCEKKTQNKFAFLKQRAACDMYKQLADPEVYERIHRSFEINRDLKSTREDRDVHARHTSMCDVSSGLPLK